MFGSILGCDRSPPVPLELKSDHAKADEYAAELHAAIWSRLALIPAVAQSKFHSQRPIRDTEREADVIERFRQLAMNRGIHPGFAEQVIAAQIAAATLTQEVLHAEWKSDPPPEDERLRDLVRDLRPSIDHTNERILIALQLLGSVPDECQRAIQDAYQRRSPLPPQVADDAWNMAWKPLLEAPKNFMPGREALGQIPSIRSTLPDYQPLLPEFTPEAEATPVATEEQDEAR